MSAAGIPIVRGSLCVPPAPGTKSKVRLRKSDQVVAILGDTKVAGERKLKSTGEGCAGNGGDNRLWHALAHRHRLVEKSTIVGRVLGPLATRNRAGSLRCRSAQRL